MSKERAPKRKAAAPSIDATAVLSSLGIDAVPLTRGAVRELAERLRAEDVPVAALVPACVESHGQDACVALLYAGALAGQRPRAAHVGPLVTGGTEPVLFAALVGCAQGDKVGALLDAVESGRAPDDREALALFLATHLELASAAAGGPGPSPRLRTLLRRVARRQLDEEPGALVALAATALKDPDVLSVASPWMPDAQHAEYRKLGKELQRALEAPPEEALPETAPKLVSGLTVRRVAEKVGRNDPCPCGSGKKYKKCCEGKEAQSDIAGMSRAEYVARVAAKLSQEDLQVMRADDLERLDFAALAEPALVLVMRRLAAFARWPAAEHALAAMVDKKDLKESRDAYRCDLLASALAARAFDVAERIRGALDDAESMPPGDALSLELRRPTAKTLRRMEALANEGLAAEPKSDAFVELAYAVLDHYPALGILIARASLSAERPKDSNAMLGHIEDARDVLGLPPRDPSWDAFDELLDRDVSRRLADAEGGAQGEGERLAAEADALRHKVRSASEHIETLERKLRAQEQSFKDATAASARGAIIPAESEDAEQRKRMRTKLEELKALIAEGNRERADLRRQLAEASEELAPRADAPPPEAADDEDDEGLGEDVPEQEERDVLVPVFATAALKGIASAPPKVAREAVVLSAQLAAGEPAAWRGCKRLLAPSPPVWSARCGIRYRLLFRPGDGRLDVLELVARRELETVLKRY